jgi:hypothetical protein
VIVGRVSGWDWVTISALATAAGTLVLALATFASVRSANRAARVAERRMLESLRPMLTASRLQDPPEKIRVVDGRWSRFRVAAVLYSTRTDRLPDDGAAKRGRGLAVLHGWQCASGYGPARTSTRSPTRCAGWPETFSRPGRHRVLAGALCNPSQPISGEVVRAVEECADGPIIDLQYGDDEGGSACDQPFALTPHESEDGATRWLASMSRHWNLDPCKPTLRRHIDHACGCFWS